MQTKRRLRRGALEAAAQLEGDTVTWLNASSDALGRDAAAYRRVTRLLQSVERLIELDSERDYPEAIMWPKARRREPTAGQALNLKARLQAVNRINRALRRYLVPRAGFSPGRFKLELAPLKARSQFGEAHAVQAVLQLEAKERSRGRWFSPLFQCVQCGNWAIRRRRGQKFCRERCRQARYAQSPESKKTRRDY